MLRRPIPSRFVPALTRGGTEARRFTTLSANSFAVQVGMPKEHIPGGIALPTHDAR